MKAHDLSGQKFGEWTVINYAGDRKWNCVCSCGTEKVISGYSITSGKSKSCGCLRKKLNSDNSIDNLKGLHYGEWEVLEYAGNSMWKCRCSCGKIVNVKGQSLKEGKSRSCGHNTTGFKDLTGMTFGDWQVIEYAGNQKWKCKCICGNESLIDSYSLTHGLTKSCGKHNISSKIIDITGEKFGYLTVVRYIGRNKWLCKCECGNYVIKYSHNLRRSSSISCGCKDVVAYTKEEILDKIKEFRATFGYDPFREDLELILDRSKTSIERYVQRYNLEKYLNSKFRSKGEFELYKLFPTNFINTRNIISGIELDLYYPESRYAIEFNGSYWHSSQFKTILYHKNKTLACKNQGITLFHVFEYEWDNDTKRNIIISLINNKLNNSQNVIYARKTEVKLIDYKEAKEFLDINHLQGSCAAKIYVGCYYNTELIGVMTFGTPRFNTAYEYEMLRLCWKLNTIVVGGTDKLFKFFIKNYDPNSIITYSDLSKFTGKSYEKLGFNVLRLSEPNYVWWNTKLNFTVSRYKSMKSKLIADGLGQENETEEAIMTRLGYIKIYDCGNKVLVWNK